jgi:hypothetical protein
MSSKRGPGPSEPPPIRREGLVEATSRLLAERLEHTAHDTLADDCAESLLSALDEALWMAEEMYETEEHCFAHASRQAEHIEDFRRLLYRLHLILVDWEETLHAPGRAP